MKSTRGALQAERPSKKPRMDDESSQSEFTPYLEQDLGLPLELWLMILKRLDSKADLQRINRVCKQFHALIKDQCYLWYQLHWPSKEYNLLHDEVDVSMPIKRIFELANGDVAASLIDGSFSILPATQDQWLHLPGHIEPENFYAALPIKNIISLYHNQIATCADDGIRIWNRLTGKLIKHLTPQHEQDQPFQLLPAMNNKLLSASPDGSVYLYSSDFTNVTRMESAGEETLGKLRRVFFWQGRIIGIFDKAVVSWNKDGESPIKHIDIDELHAKLTNQVNKIITAGEAVASGQIDNNDLACFNHPEYEGLRFDPTFCYWDGYIQVLLNKTFIFIVDIFNLKSAVFLGVGQKIFAAHDESGNYVVMHQYALNHFKAYTGLGTREGMLKYPSNITLACNVKTSFVQPSGLAFFILKDNRAVRWNVKTGEIAYFALEVPDAPNYSPDFFAYGSDDWMFTPLLSRDLIGVNVFGDAVIWDMRNGKIMQHFSPSYLCDTSKMQHVLQMRNNNILIQRIELVEIEGRPNDVDQENHMCIYRFLPPPRSEQAEDASKADSGILSTKLKM